MSQHPVEAASDSCNSASQKPDSLLSSFQRKFLTKSLQTALRSEYRKRIEIMLLADQGYSQTQICRMLGCCHDTVRYWVAIAQSGKAHQWYECKIGRPKSANDAYLKRLQELASRSPREYGYPFQQWTGEWLSKHLVKETGICVSARHVNRLLREMGLSTRSK